ncbi:MAG: acyl-CoA thioesterase [Herpetosiphonaceae bacterium]|nr:acyl-CoA thioesterase [Herpetosiphonaceae bacterium]
MSVRPDYPFTQPVVVAFRDIDALGHVNNATYLSYFEDARVRYLLQLLDADRPDQLQVIVAENTVQYRKPVFYGDELEIGVRVGVIGTKSLAVEYALYRLTDQALMAEGRTVLVWYDYAAQHSVSVPDTFRQAVDRVQGHLQSFASSSKTG